MPKIERFEDIDAWREARALVKSIYMLTNEGLFARDYGLRDQIRRAAVSIMSNIAEGFERGGNKEFRHFLFVAKASAAEVRSQAYVAFDLGYIDDASFKELHLRLVTISQKLSGFIKYLQKLETTAQRSPS